MIARVGQAALPLCGSVWGEELERGQCCCLASGGLPGTHHISSHFTHFPYVAVALPAVALVVNPSVGGFAYVLMPCGPFKWTLLKIWHFLLPPKPLLVFTARSYVDLSSWHWNPGLCSVTWAGIACSQGNPPEFYPPHVSLGPP